jgi:hypothetical protein
MRVRVSVCRMLVGKLAVLLSCRGVLLGLFMLADRVMVLRLMMVMRGRMMVSSCVVMVLTRWMFRFLCHFDALVCVVWGRNVQCAYRV